MPMGCGSDATSQTTPKGLTTGILAAQTSHGKPLAVPLFILLAQNRQMHIKLVDKNGGEFVAPRQQPLEAQLAESRVRTVCDRYDQMNKVMIQVHSFSVHLSDTAMSVDPHVDLQPWQSWPVTCMQSTHCMADKVDGSTDLRRLERDSFLSWLLLCVGC